MRFIIIYHLTIFIMKVSRNFNLFLVVLSLLFFVGCSSDDDHVNAEDPASDIKDTPEFAIFERDLKLPTALKQSTDPQAQILQSHFQTVTLYQSFQAFTEVPQEADVSYEPIEATGSFNRYTTYDTPDYTVYTYSYGYTTIAYQFSIQNGMNVVEIFYSDEETNGFIRYMELRQSLDDTHGSLKFLGDEDYYVYEWTWQVNPDDSMDVTMTVFDEDWKFELTYYPDMSGSLIMIIDGEIDSEYHWNADGSGTWIDHTFDESGSWEANS